VSLETLLTKLVRAALVYRAGDTLQRGEVRCNHATWLTSSMYNTMFLETLLLKPDPVMVNTVPLATLKRLQGRGIGCMEFPTEPHRRGTGKRKDSRQCGRFTRWESALGRYAQSQTPNQYCGHIGRRSDKLNLQDNFNTW
jgi:hypothetical protein